MSAREILKALREAIRAGFYAWPGGYQMLAVMSDGESLCCKCARAEYRSISRATRDRSRDGWACEGIQIHWEGAPEVCAHCGDSIPSAYGDDSAEATS